MKRLYALLLYLFPSAYREEYGDELQAVFALSLDDAVRGGWGTVASALWRELLSLPGAVLREHLRERRKANMTRKFASWFEIPAGSLFEFLAVVAPFIVVYGALILLASTSDQDTPAWIFASVMLGAFFLLLMIGLFKGLPRWFLPYFGFLFSLLSGFAHPGSLNPDWHGLVRFRYSWFLYSLLNEGLFWVGLMVLLFLLVLIVAIVPKFRPFYRRLRDDWSLLAFIVYGATPLALYFTFDDYQGEAPYVLTAYVILLVGGWLYLRAAHPWKRFEILFAGLALSMGVAVMGKYILYIPKVGFGFTKLSEATSTIIIWIWLALIMLLSLGVKWLPRRKSTLQAGEPVTG